MTRVPLWTGYTHRWSEVPADDWAPLLMASTETIIGYIRAKAASWRVFHVGSETHERVLVPSPSADIEARRMLWCPADEARPGGKRRTCAQCGLCAGLGMKPDAPDIYIYAHGATAGAILKTYGAPA